MKNKKSETNKGLLIGIMAALLVVIALGLAYAHNENNQSRYRNGMNAGMMDDMESMGMSGMHGMGMMGMGGMHGMDLEEMKEHMQEHMEEHGFTDEGIKEHWQEMKEHCPMMRGLEEPDE
ncbi:MAG: hypothetical protein AABX59_04095 [Nanoarchaeota archaeon]